MRRIEELNAALQSRNAGVRVSVDKLQSGKLDAWLEYFDSKRNLWRALHHLGTFSNESQCHRAALEKLRIDKYLI